MSDELRKSEISVGIQRTLNTAKYESIVVSYNITETITWKDIAERDQKTQNWVNKLCDQYKLVQSKVLEEIGVEEKRAWVKDKAEYDSE